MESSRVADVVADTRDPRAGLRAVASLWALTERLLVAEPSGLIEAVLRRLGTTTPQGGAHPTR